jgi:hypothetical protein
VDKEEKQEKQVKREKQEKQGKQEKQEKQEKLQGEGGVLSAWNPQLYHRMLLSCCWTFEGEI